MIWDKTYNHQPRYEHTSTNQHGQRFKQTCSKVLNVARLSCKNTDNEDMRTLVLLGHTLGVPVHYDFDKHICFIEVMSADVVRKGT